MRQPSLSRILFIVIILSTSGNLFGALAIDSLVEFAHPWTSPYSVDPDYPQSLVNREGNHLFVLNKTEWAFFLCEYPEQILKKARNQGVNVIRVCLEGTPYFNDLGYDMFPWAGTRNKPEWNSFNEIYWKQVQDRIKLAGEYGIGIDLVLYFSIKPTIADTTAQKLYWETILKRLSIYSNILTWEIMNEYTKNESFQDVAGTFFSHNDPCKRPVCSSDGTTDDALWPDKKWMNLAVVHTCTGSTEKHDLAEWYLSVARNTRAHAKPAFNNESGREKRHKNDDPVHRRKQGWLFASAGCFWTFHAWEGCEGINDTVYNGPGAEYLLPMKLFFDSINYWKMNPNFSAGFINSPDLVHATLADANRNIISTYICTRKTNKTVENGQLQIRLPDGKYSIEIYNPANLTLIDSQILESKNLGVISMVQLPKFTDDVVVKVLRKTFVEKSKIEGTL